MRCRGSICCGGWEGSRAFIECLPCVDRAGYPSLLRVVHCAIRLLKAGGGSGPVSAYGRGSCLGAAAYLTSFEDLGPWEAAVWAGRPSLAGFFRDSSVFIDILGVEGAEAVVTVGERLRFGVGHIRASKAVRDAIALSDALEGLIPDRGGWAPVALAGAALMEMGLPYGVEDHAVRSASLAKSAPEVMAGLGVEGADALYYAIKYHVPGSGDPGDDPELPESVAWEAEVASAILKVVAVTSNYPDPVDILVDPPRLKIGVSGKSPPHLLEASRELANLAGLRPAGLGRWGERLSSQNSN